MKKGLGKGLDALLLDNSIDEVLSEGPVRTVSLQAVEPNKKQPRKYFDKEALQVLADSIAANGLLQPIVVRAVEGNRYQIISGERRWRACRMAGLQEVPVVVREEDDRAALELGLIENLQREDLNVVEEAEGYRVLMAEYAMTQEQVAAKVGRSRPAVANALRLLQLPEAVTEMVSKGELSAGHARTVLAFEGVEAQIAAATAAVQKGLSVRELEKMAKAAKRTPKTPAAPKRRDSFYDEVELALRENLGRQVKVTATAKGGVLQVEFFDPEDLRALANKLADADA